MNARPNTTAKPHAPAPRFDRKFIEDHKLMELYLTGKLPFKGARDLEAWCRANPEYLNELHLSERTTASLKLLEAAGKPVDLAEPTPPWWKSMYVLIGLGVLTFITLIAFWALFARFMLVKGELADSRMKVDQGSLVQPLTQTAVSIAPDHAAGIDHARIKLSRAAPQLMDVHIDLAYTGKLTQFRMFVDKKDQGRALILNDLLKDSNNELHLTLNSSGLAAGIYNVRLEALPFKGSPIPIGWLILEVT